MKRTLYNILILLLFTILAVSIVGCGGGSNGGSEVSLTISSSGNGTTTPAAGTHEYSNGTLVNLTATPASGWSFSHWGGTHGDQVTDDTVLMNGNKTITAVFVQNLLVNPGFETNDAWTYNPYYGSYDSNHPRSGANCFRFTIGSCYAEQFIESGFNAGDIIKASFWGYVDSSSDNYIRLTIQFNDSSNSHISSVTIDSSMPGPSSYTKYENNNIIIPAGTARIRVYITGAGSGTVYVDDLVVGY